MPSFDIVSEVDKQEIDNALNQARKELATRFDFKGDRRGDRLRKGQDHSHCRGRGAPARPARDRHRQTFETRGRPAQRRSGGAGDFVDRPRPAGTENSAGTGRREGQGNHPRDQGRRLQSAESAPGPADSRHREEARRAAGSDRLCAEQRFRRRDQFQELSRLKEAAKSGFLR